jgi:cytohesin
MFKLGKQFKPMMLCFSVITFLLIGYAESVGPLHEAAKKGNLDKVKRLIEEGANVNVKDEKNDTPLYIAVGQGNKEIAELLISKGANVNVVCTFGYTPLHWAVIALGGEKELAELLISKGANVNAVDKKGMTPLDLANYSHHKALAELLIKHGGETRSPWSGSAFGRLL